MKRITANKTANKTIVYPELSYQIMGALFKVHNKLGPNYQEKYYQRAVEAEFKKQNIKYKREKMIPLSYENENIGRYFIDFIIDDKIALEIKTDEFFRRKYLQQVLDYLSASKLKLAIVVNFRKGKLFYKRIVNPKVEIANQGESPANNSE